MACHCDLSHKHQEPVSRRLEWIASVLCCLAGIVGISFIDPSVSLSNDGLDPYAMSNQPPPSAVSSSVVAPAMVAPASATMGSSGGYWGFQLFPEGLIYRPYLAGPKESRTSLLFHDSGNGGRVDASLGGQWGLFRIGSADRYFPKGVQFGVEASAQIRRKNIDSANLLTTDLRCGFPLTFSRNNHQTKLAWYFLRSDPSREILETIGAIGDEGFFERQALVLGHSIDLTERFRVYGEAGYALKTVVSDKWEFQFGAECVPVCPTRIFGAPFLAANALLREEVDFGGTFTLQGGWAWRRRSGKLFRVGLQYANGKSSQFALQDKFEQQIGLGFWIDN